MGMQIVYVRPDGTPIDGDRIGSAKGWLDFGDLVAAHGEDYPETWHLTSHGWLDPAEQLVELELRRCQRALEHGNYEIARGILIPFKKMDVRGRYSQELADYERRAVGTGTLHLETIPPGCRVRCRRGRGWRRSGRSRD